MADIYRESFATEPDGVLNASRFYTQPFLGSDIRIPASYFDYQPSGQVLGTDTGTPSQSQPQPTVSQPTSPPPSRGTPQVNEVVDGWRWTGVGWENANVGGAGGGGQTEEQRIMAEQRSGIESAYGSYEQQLDAILNEGLPAQQTAQEDIARSQHERGGVLASSQLREGQELLGTQEEKTETQTAKTLKDISTNLRNSFMAGNVFLGAQGAGDSSAANQYAYALTKLGSQQRGDVQAQKADIMNEIGARASKLKRLYNDETNRIKSEFDQKISGIAQWFAEQQQALRLNKGQLGINKMADLQAASQNLLNIAIRQKEFFQTEAANRREKLESWAMSNATTIQQLQQNMQGITGQQLASVPGAQPIVGQPTMSGGNISAKAAYQPGSSYNREEKQPPLFSRPVEYLA